MDEVFVGDPAGWLDRNYTYQPETIKVKRTIRTIETYDALGKLISREVITEEEDYYDKQVWPSNNFIVECAGTNTGEIMDNTTNTTRLDENIPYTLTNGMTIADIKC